MDLSLIQKDILITLITLYHQHSHPIKGEEIADVIKRNPGTVRNQMQALKAIGLVDRFGNLEDAIGWAGRLGGIRGEIQAVYAPEDEPPLLRLLTESWVRRAIQGVYGSA